MSTPAADRASSPSSIAWSPSEPARGPGEPAEAFLLRRAAEYPIPTQVASLGLLGASAGALRAGAGALGSSGVTCEVLGAEVLGRAADLCDGGWTSGTALLAAETALREADEREALALWSAPFGRVWAMWEGGDLTQPVFAAYCAKARLHREFSHPWGYQRGAPDWTRAPCCVWEAVLCGLSPNSIRESRERGLGPSDEVYEDYRQVWRRGAARLSDNWIDAGEGPLRLRAAEALALLQNPVRRAPLDRERERALRSFALASVRR